jgi:hypothetical protein
LADGYDAVVTLVSFLISNAVSNSFPFMKKSIIFFSAFCVAAMALASCESFNPFSPSTATSPSGPPVTGQTNRATYEMPLGRNQENYVPTDY